MTDCRHVDLPNLAFKQTSNTDPRAPGVLYGVARVAQVRLLGEGSCSLHCEPAHSSLGTVTGYKVRAKAEGDEHLVRFVERKGLCIQTGLPRCDQVAEHSST